MASPGLRAATLPVSPASVHARSAYEVPSVRRAFQILSLLQAAGRAMGISEISRALGIGKGAAFAILKTLEQWEAVTRDGDGKLYRLGAGLVKLGDAVTGHEHYVQAARRGMERLASEIGLACFLSAPYGTNEFIVVAKAESTEKIKLTLDLGEHFHALGGAHGKALLAWEPPPVMDRVIRQLGLPRYTPRSLTEVEAFKDALQRTRRDGFAASYGEYMIGVNSVAAPIFDPGGDVVLILKTIGPANRLPARRMREVGRRLRRVAEAITAELGGRYPDGAG